METDAPPTFTVVVETTGPLGPEIQVLREEGEDAREAAVRTIHRWHDEDSVPTTTIEELEDGSVHRAEGGPAEPEGKVALLALFLRHEALGGRSDLTLCGL